MRPLEKLICALVVLAMVFVILGVITAIIPYEEVPRVEPASNGTAVYVIQSLRETVVCLVAPMLFLVVTCGCVAIAGRYRLVTFDAEPSSSFSRCVGRIIGAVLVLILLSLPMGQLIIAYYGFRKVVVGPEQVVVSSLFRSWTLQRSEVNEVKLLRRENIGRRMRDTDLQYRDIDLQYVISTCTNVRFASMEVSGLSPHGPVVKQHQAVFEDMARALHGGAGVRKGARERGAKPHVNHR